MKLSVDDGLTWEEAKENRDEIRDDLIKRGADAQAIKRVRVQVHASFEHFMSNSVRLFEPPCLGHVQRKCIEGKKVSGGRTEKSLVLLPLPTKSRFTSPQNGFWVSRNDWMAWKRPQIVLATEVRMQGLFRISWQL